MVLEFSFPPQYPVTVHCDLGYQMCIEVIYVVYNVRVLYNII